MIFRNPDGKYAGRIIEGIYVSPRTRKRHFFWKYRGYAVSEDILAKLVELDVELIRLDIKDTKESFTCPVQKFLKGRKINYDDPQRLVALVKMDKVDSKQTTLFQGG